MTAASALTAAPDKNAESRKCRIGDECWVLKYGDSGAIVDAVPMGIVRYIDLTEHDYAPLHVLKSDGTLEWMRWPNNAYRNRLAALTAAAAGDENLIAIERSNLSLHEARLARTKTLIADLTLPPKEPT